MNLYFNFNGTLHKHVDGGDMISPISLKLPNDFLA